MTKCDFRISEKVSTPTSVVLMAINTVFGKIHKSSHSRSWLIRFDMCRLLLETDDDRYWSWTWCLGIPHCLCSNCCHLCSSGVNSLKSFPQTSSCMLDLHPWHHCLGTFSTSVRKNMIIWHSYFPDNCLCCHSHQCESWNNVVCRYWWGSYLFQECVLMNNFHL